jgi:transcriptional regulator with XRE-family HTH domain
MTDKLVLREREAAEMLGVSVSSLRRWRLEKRGPTYVKLERCVGYLIVDLQEFLSKNTVCSSKGRND